MGNLRRNLDALTGTVTLDDDGDLREVTLEASGSNGDPLRIALSFEESDGANVTAPEPIEPGTPCPLLGP
jgi:hypothetical protein